MKNQTKKGPRLSCGGGQSNRRMSVGGLQTPKPEIVHPAKATPNTTRQAKKTERVLQYDPPADDGFSALSAGMVLVFLSLVLSNYVFLATHHCILIGLFCSL